MESPWFGKKANGYTGGPVTWQGWLVTIGCIGGGLACHFLLKSPANDLASGACIIVLIVTWLLTYDPDTESY
jgi:hypothetical protein